MSYIYVKTTLLSLFCLLPTAIDQICANTYQHREQ